MSYAEKLRDPRWQKRRLGVLERAGWKCQNCGNREMELQVHHLVYGGEPWDASDDTLECLCRECHQEREAFNAMFGRWKISTERCFLHRDILRGLFASKQAAKMDSRSLRVALLRSEVQAQLELEQFAKTPFTPGTKFAQFAQCDAGVLKRLPI